MFLILKMCLTKNNPVLGDIFIIAFSSNIIAVAIMPPEITAMRISSIDHFLSSLRIHLTDIPESISHKDSASSYESSFRRLWLPLTQQPLRLGDLLRCHFAGKQITVFPDTFHGDASKT